MSSRNRNQHLFSQLCCLLFACVAWVAPVAADSAGVAQKATTSGLGLDTSVATYSFDFDAQYVNFGVARVFNSNPALRSNILRLELWAYSRPLDSVPQVGYKLGHLQLGQIAPNSDLRNVNASVPLLVSPPAGDQAIVLVLSEFDVTYPNDGFRPVATYNYPNRFTFVGFEGIGIVYEFYHPQLKHYFRTASSTEANAVLAEVYGAGWERTYDDFNAYGRQVANNSFDPVCRFYAAGPNSHFYTIDAAECIFLRDRNPSNDPALGWAYEGIAFYAKKHQNGFCPTGTRAIYRVYNNRGVNRGINDANHRFTTSLVTRSQMLAIGWIDEGVGFCTIP